MKLRERIIICFSITFVFFTLLLVIDLQFDIGYTGHRFLVPARHGRVYISDTASDGDRSIYRKFQNRFGGGNVAVEETPSPQDISPKAFNVTTELIHDPFADLVQYTFPPEEASYTYLRSRVVITTQEDRSRDPTVADLLNISFDGTLQSQFHKRISKREMYKENEPLVDTILKKMQTDKIVHVKEKDGGTQIKLVIEFESGDRALFKPMRFPREQQTLPNHFYFTDYERHNAEIAAFHLDRILELRRAMPVTGRILNMTTEIYNVADSNLLKTFFISPANNYCFHGHCSYYCDTSHAVCGNPDTLEGSFAAFLPEKDLVDRTLRKHPWRRSYHKRKKAVWETDPNYCDGVRISPPYNDGFILLDLIDTSILDFLMGNMDRHHFETFTVFGNKTFPIHLDHGRAFGRPFHDELSILAPLTQCCMIKQSTLKLLIKFHNGSKKLSDLMRESLAKDPLHPVLWEPHLVALDRRVEIILEAVRTCIQKSVSTTFSEESETVSKTSQSESTKTPPIID